MLLMASRLKNLAQQARGAVRDVRQAVNELAEVLSPSPQPSLVRVPVRNGARAAAPRFRSPYGASARQFSTHVTARAANQAFRPPRFIKPFTGGSLAQKIWPFSAFRNAAVRTGPFPSGLYRNFVNLNSRNFSTYGGSASREAVQNLTANVRCMFNNGGDTLLSLKMSQKQKSNLSYHGSMSQKEAEQTFKLARCESSDVERPGSYVEFPLPKMELSIPSVSFMNSEILGSLDDGLEHIKGQIDSTRMAIETIFEAYGSLPIERRYQSLLVHFPNLDADELEKLLIDLGINEGVVYSMDGNEDVVDEMSSSASSVDLSDIIEDNVPGLLSSDSECSDTESLSSDDYFPVLSSSSDGFQYASPIETNSVNSSPVIIAQDERSLSEVSLNEQWL
ncbi:Stationary phase protein 5 [Cyberlindnera fabianii]|uniref:Stationary phase protein 5 n=1 Tax=Cyberlindnera fabianii TaxID=36022 RepID=A0A1V2L709_CYBFA|nr:Stationary phase protein 5 [Cyberlindnera fabianii]